MPQAFVWTVTATGVTKTQAVVLAMEFWTSQGFAEHTSSYNRLVLRRNNYGKIGSWLNTALSTEVPWQQIPVELEILVQIMPDHAKYSLTFRVSSTLQDMKDAEWRAMTECWVDDFIKFNTQWTTHAQRALEQ